MMNPSSACEGSGESEINILLTLRAVMLANAQSSARLTSSVKWVNSSFDKKDGFQSSCISWALDLTASSEKAQHRQSTRLIFVRQFQLQQQTVVVFQKKYRRLEHGRLVHFSGVCAHQAAQLVDQHVELVPSLLLAQVS